MAFLPAGFCENRNIEVLKDIFEKELSSHKSSRQRLLLRNLISGNHDTDVMEADIQEKEVFDNIEVKFITHQGGCGGIRQDSVSWPGYLPVMLTIQMWPGQQS